MLFGYIWVATSDDEALYGQQRQLLLAAGVTEARLYQDMEGQRRQPRPGLTACLSALNSGDTLVVWQLQRLVDDRNALLNLLEDFHQRQLGLQVLEGQGKALSTNQSSLVQSIPVIAAVIELEDYLAREATLAGLAMARERGQVLGAKPKMTPAILRQAMSDLANTKASFTAIAEAHGVTRATLYNYLNGDGSLKPAGIRLLEMEE